ncbi:MAG: hypothetical protein J0M04_15375 [Verrucomicrobia bacterium]|nr:hypothetical protein [Verrucomicrobiota bacterium]
MKLWRIRKPDYRTDREERANNGSIKFPFGLPGVECCGTWGGCDLLDLQCPIELRKMRALTERRPVIPDELEEIRSTLRRYPGFANLGIMDLTPGMRFMPPRFSPPRIVDNDFLWPASEAPVVSPRVAALLGRSCPGSFVGIPMPECSDWILLIIKRRTLPPIERRSDRICSRCGRPNKVSAPTKLAIFEDMIPEGEMFLLDTTLHILITDRLKQQLDEAGVRNIAFDPIMAHAKP